MAGDGDKGEIARRLGLQAGANVIMAVITGTQFRAAYQLYDGKPCLNESASQCRSRLQRRIESIGETIGFDPWGDSPHFHRRALPRPGCQSRRPLIS
jgi:biotin synthase